MSAQSSNQGFLKDKSHYVSQFLEKTLGVSQILNQFSEATQVVHQETDLGFFIEDYTSYSTAENELLFKMIAAMKLEPSRYKVCDLSQNTKYKHSIYFLDKPQNKNQTYSPRELLKNSGNKHTAVM